MPAGWGEAAGDPAPQSQDRLLTTQKGKTKEPDICFLTELFEALGPFCKTERNAHESAESRQRALPPNPTPASLPPPASI